MILPDPDAVLEAAQAYTKLGWRVIPVHTTADTPSGCSCYSEKRQACNSAGKHPVEPRWQAQPALSGADLYGLFVEENRNIGIATGELSDFWVLDVDLDKPGTRERMLALQAGRKLPQTRVIKTPGGGYHYYFAMPDFNVTNSAKRLPDGVDIRGTGGMVVAPPSISHKGGYEIIIPDFNGLPQAPDWLLELVRPLPPTKVTDLESLPKLTDLPEAEQRRLESYSLKVARAELDRLQECSQKGWGGPGWNQTTYEVACTLAELAQSPWCPLTLEQVHDQVLAEAPRDQHFTDAEVEGCFSSALKTVAGKARPMPAGRPEITVIPGDPLTDPDASTPHPTEPPAAGDAAGLRKWTDIGNAHRMVDRYADRLRWVPEAQQWALFEDGAWELGSKEIGVGLVHDLFEDMLTGEAFEYSDEPGGDEEKPEPSLRDKFVKWAVAQQQAARVNACVAMAAGRPELLAKMERFDNMPLITEDGAIPSEQLFNAADCVIDLKTGKSYDQDPELLMMMQSPIRYVPNAEHPRWDAFLERCLPDPEIRDYLQKAMGYSLTGSMAEQVLFIHHGPGANGKSVFLIIAAHVAGDYNQVVPRETLLAKGSTTEHPTSVARMRGKRFMQASETAANRRLDEETVKGLTGGEQQTARFMNANFFDFTPTGKIHFVTNHLPKLTDAESIWRRLHLIKWGQTIPIEERDPKLAEKIITEEAEGVLAWAVEGARRWYAERLQIPRSMREDLADYRTDQDTLGEFLSSRTELDPDAFVASQDLYAAYSNWAFRNGIKLPLTAQDLRKHLKERGIPEKRTSRARGFAMRVLASAEPSMADLL